MVVMSYRAINAVITAQRVPKIREQTGAVVI